jgi:hypothetical protein
MLLDDFWWGVGDFYLSESGHPSGSQKSKVKSQKSKIKYT